MCLGLTRTRLMLLVGITSSALEREIPSMPISAECPRSLRVGCPCSWYERLQLESMPPLWLHTYSLSRLLRAAIAIGVIAIVWLEGVKDTSIWSIFCNSASEKSCYYILSHLFPICSAKNLKAKTFRHQTCGSSSNRLNRIHGMIRWTGQDDSTSTSKDLTLRRYDCSSVLLHGMIWRPNVPSAPAQWWAPLAGAFAGIFQVSPGAKIYRVLDLGQQINT